MKEEESQVIQLGKNNILIYNNVLASTKRLTDAQLGAVLRLLLAKNIDNNFELLHDDALVELTSHLLWDTISACNKNHAKKSEQQKAAGRASAEARRKKQAELEAKAQQAENLNTVKPEAPELEDKPKQDNHESKTQKTQKQQQLDWQCVAGLELTEQQQQEAIRIRKANNTSKKTRTFTQASLKQFLTQVKYSVDAGISIDEVLEVWEAKQWVTWTHSYYSKEIASDIKAQSQTAKDLKNAQAVQESGKDNNWDDLEMTDTVREMLEISYKDRMNETNKGGSHG